MGLVASQEAAQQVLEENTDSAGQLTDLGLYPGGRLGKHERGPRSQTGYEKTVDLLCDALKLQGCSSCMFFTYSIQVWMYIPYI